MNRRSVWSALSDLFLDTETRWYLPRVARVGLEHGCSWAELTFAYHEEVAPVVAVNLLDVAGDWGGFPDDWLWGQIEARRPGSTLISRQVTRAMGQLWVAVGRLYAHLASLPSTQWLAREHLLTALAALLLEKRWTGSFSLYRHLATLVAEEWDLLQPVYAEAESIYRDLLVHPGDPDAAENAANWRWFGRFYAWAHSQSTPAESVVTVCEDLSFLYRCQELKSDHPCLPRLQASMFPGLRAWLDSPLHELYGELERAQRNWEANFNN